MAVKQNPKSLAIADAYSIKQFSDSRLRKAAIVPINRDKSFNVDPVCYFLINPSSWKETLASNWIPQVTPGQSSPPLQWMSGGPRTVSFDALVTADTSYFVDGTQTATTSSRQGPGGVGNLQSFFGAIGAAFAKASPPAPRLPSGDQPSDLDITSYLNFYRSLLFPTYDDKDSPAKLIESPPLVLLFVGTAIPKYPVGSNLISSKTDTWVVTNLEINITKQLPNLAPLEAVVSFQLTQYNMRSYSRDRFLDRGQ